VGVIAKAPLRDWLERGGVALAGGGICFEDEYRYLIATCRP
jgi:hypothetical protein